MGGLQINNLGLEYREPQISSFMNREYWEQTELGSGSEQKSINKIKHFLTGKKMEIEGTVAVVGSSDTLKNRGLGSKIDTFDQVFRFNLAPVDLGFKDDVGSKASYYFLSKNITTWEFVKTSYFEQICSNSAIICYPGHYKNILPYTEPYHFELSINELNKVYESRLGSKYTPFSHKNHPRNGIKLIAALIDSGIKPTLFGFDLHDREINSHYFDNENQTEAGTNQIGHKPSLEYILLNQLLEKGLISLG